MCAAKIQVQPHGKIWTWRGRQRPVQKPPMATIAGVISHTMAIAGPSNIAHIPYQRRFAGFAAIPFTTACFFGEQTIIGTSMT